MKAKQYYDCFPEYTYNTAFGSLLTGLGSINSNIGIAGDDIIEMCNNSAWNIDCNLQRQSIEEIVKRLIDFLDEFLLFLSSIIECQPSYSQYSLQKIVDTAERIHQLRSTLLIQINHTNEDLKNSSLLDIPSICLILHELASFIRSLCKEQQQHFGTIIKHPHTTILTQLLDRIEKMIRSCMACVSMNSNSQCCQHTVPVIYPCLNGLQMADNARLSSECGCSCNESNICVPWSFFEKMKNSVGEQNHIFGLMYGIKDENIRRKLGYRTRKHRSPKRMKQKYKGNVFSNKEQSFDNDREWIVGSTRGEISPTQKTSDASIKEEFKITKQQETEGKNERRSQNSIIPQGKNTLNRLGSSSRTPSRQQSPVNSQQLSPLFRSNSDVNESIRLHSIHDHLTGSDSKKRVSTHTTISRTRELPITSMLDHSVSQRTSSRLIQQPSNIYENNDDNSTQSLSFHSYEYQTPSKTTIKVSRESSQSLSSAQSKSVPTRQSNVSTLSLQTPLKTDIQEKKSTSSAIRSDSKRSSKKSINQNPSIHQTHIDNIDSTVIMTSNDKTNQNDNISNKSWQQRLASPSSITSSQRINSTHLSQNIRSPILSKQLSLNEPTSDSHFDLYSEHQISPSTSFMNETYVKGSQSAEGEKNTAYPSDTNHKKGTSTPQFSSIHTYRQQSIRTTSDNDNSSLFVKTKKSSSRSVSDRKRKLYNQETDCKPLQSNSQGYFHKLMNCFRRTNIDRSRYQNK